MRISLEIAIDGTRVRDAVASAVAACQGGADRLELCASMEEDGLTPPADVVSGVRSACPDFGGLLSMIRPRSGGFEYSPGELADMVSSIDSAARAGADGVVFGATKGGFIDRDATAALVAEADSLGLSTTFHRAFDVVTDRRSALETLMQLGVTRVLTAGIPWGSGASAESGVDQLAQDLEVAGSSIEVVVGGGISLANLPRILSGLSFAAKCLSVHAYSAARSDGRTSADLVRQLRELLNHGMHRHE